MSSRKMLLRFTGTRWAVGYHQLHMWPPIKREALVRVISDKKINMELALLHLLDVREWLDESIPRELQPMIQGYVEDVLSFEGAIYYYYNGQHTTLHAKRELVRELFASALDPIVTWRDQSLAYYCRHHRIPYPVHSIAVAEEYLGICLKFAGSICDRSRCYYARRQDVFCTCGSPLVRLNYILSPHDLTN